MEDYLVNGNIRGKALGNDRLTIGGYEVSIYSTTNDGYVYYDFWREKQRQSQTQSSSSPARQPAESSYTVNPFTGQTNEYYDAIPKAYGNPGLILLGMFLLIATIVADFASGGASLFDDPITIGMALEMMSRSASSVAA